VNRRRPGALLLPLVSALLCAASAARGASLFDPALRFRVLPTEHFVIYFHQGAQPLAERLAPIAEETWRALQRPLGVTPPPRTHVVLADQTELANGYATPLPRDTIVIFTTWPAGSDTIGDTDDWLRVAFTHEFTHIVHLDRSESWARAVRALFGRSAVAFPNLFLPTWQIEGLAVYEESDLTGEGRLHAGDFRAIVGEAARARALEPLDRVNGGVTDWPNGAGPYAYGLGFHEYLARRFGRESLGRLADSTARQVPYFGSRAFRSVYGESLGQLWREFEAGEVGAAPAVDNDDRATRLTRDGFHVAAPRFDRFGCGGCPPEILYAASTPHGFPSLKRVALGGGTPTEVTRRFLGSTTAAGRATLYFDQLERQRNVGLYGDLYALDRATGQLRPITSEARLTEPDLSPDERRLAAVQDRVGSRALVLVSVDGAAIDTLVAEPETQFDAPRWSPDGKSIAVERHRLGGRSEIVVVDVETRNVRIVASMPDTRIATPAWTPDGRSIVAAVAPDDRPFNLFEFDAVSRAGRQLTHTTGGATWPDVSPDGKTIAFVGYTVDGFDIFTMPYPAAAASAISPFTTSVRSNPARPVTAQPAIDADGAGTLAPYSPLPTLPPTSWTPIVDSIGDQVRFGAAVTGADILGYHAYAATATWLASAPADSPVPSRARPDWSIDYAYDRWQPTLFASASSTTSFFAGPPTEAGSSTPGTRRKREFEGGVFFPVRHTRVVRTALASFVRGVDDLTLDTGTTTVDRTEARLAGSLITSHFYGYSISAEDGIAVGATTARVHTSVSDLPLTAAAATAVTVDARRYLPGFAAHHVVALRGGIGFSRGDTNASRLFLLGGPGPNTAITSFDDNALNLMRGFAVNSFSGFRIAVVNADYRFPIARPQRGLGTWPLFVHTFHGAVFADAGNAWIHDFHSSDLKTSFGGELSVDLVVGFYVPLTVATGAAWGRDGSTRAGATFYARVGRAF
jgi:hypothetical protein